MSKPRVGAVAADSGRPADELRARLVDGLLQSGVIRSGAVAEAFRTVPRHLFVPQVAVGEAYADEAIPTRWSPDGLPISSSSQPSIMAVMLEQLGLEPGQRVLEIGAGTGYNAALISRLVGPTGTVVTVDIDPDVVVEARAHLAVAGMPGVTVVCADGAAGWPGGAPYDRIVLTVGAWDLAPAWLEQLGAGGRMLLPLSLGGVQRAVAFERAADHLRSVSVKDCGFMRLRGAFAGPETARLLGDRPGLFVELDDERPVDTAALYAALSEPGAEVRTGVRVGASELWGGLSLWLALHEPDLGGLSAIGAAVRLGLVPELVVFPGQVGTRVLVGAAGLAALVRVDGTEDGGRFEVAVRGLGAGSGPLADRLAAQVAAWDAHGRPSTDGLRIRAYPAGTPAVGSTVIDKRHTRLVLDWGGAAGEA